MTTDAPPAPPQPSSDRPPRTWLRIWMPIFLVVGALVVAAPIIYGLLRGFGASTETAETIAGFLGTGLVLAAGLTLYQRLPAHERRPVLASRGAVAASVLIGIGLGLAARIATGMILAIGQALDPGVEDALDDVGDDLIPGALWQKVVLAVALVVLAPLGEELMFRGLFLRGLVRRMAFPLAALVSGLVFAVFHTQYWRIWPLVIALTGFGLVAAYVNRWRGYPANVAMHAAFNAVAAVFLFSDFGLDNELGPE